jgi:di/tricarboxylate transporter
VIIISAVFTEFTSNFACADILFPILDSVVRNISNLNWFFDFLW